MIIDDNDKKEWYAKIHSFIVKGREAIENEIRRFL